MTRRFIVAAWWVTGMGACEGSGDGSRHESAVAEAEADCEVMPGALGCERTPEIIVYDEPVWDDLDRDGFAAEVDPDDEEASVYPGARERECDGIDQDLDGADLCTPDADGDGVRASQDCDDGDPAVGPLAIDVRCNGVDENCNGIDECDRDGDGSLDHADPAPDDPAVDGLPHEPGPRELGY